MLLPQPQMVKPPSLQKMGMFRSVKKIFIMSLYFKELDRRWVRAIGIIFEKCRESIVHLEYAS